MRSRAYFSFFLILIFLQNLPGQDGYHDLKSKITGDSMIIRDNRITIGLVSGLNTYSVKMKPLYGSESLVYTPETSNEPGIIFGLSFAKLLSRKSGRLKLRSELLFTRQSFYCYKDITYYTVNPIKDDFFFNFTGLKVPVLLQYSLVGRKIIPFINAGAGYQYFLKTSYSHRQEEENSLHEIFTYYDENIKFRKGEVSASAGAGVETRILNRYNLHLEMRIEAGSGLFYNFNTDTYKKIRQHSFSQYSVQSDILLGIFF